LAAAISAKALSAASKPAVHWVFSDNGNQNSRQLKEKYIIPQNIISFFVLIFACPSEWRGAPPQEKRFKLQRPEPKDYKR